MLKISQRSLLAIVIGIIIGRIIGPFGVHFKILGDVFINTTKMLAIPMVFFSIVRSVSILKNSTSIKNVIKRTIFVFGVMAIIATAIGVIVSIMFINPDSIANLAVVRKLSLIDIFNKILPTNILKPFLDEGILQIVLIAVALAMVTRQNSGFLSICEEIHAMLVELLNWVINFSPYGVFGYTVFIAGGLDVAILAKYIKLFAVMGISYLTITLIMGLALLFFAKLNPVKFFKKSLDFQILALSTGSSKACLPFAIHSAYNLLGISKSKAELLIPLGVSISLAGLAVYLSVTTIFLANFYHVQLGTLDYVTIFFMTIFMPVGASGIVGGALLILPILLSAIGLPLEAMVFIAAIDPIINSVRTAVNLTGNVLAAILIDRWDNELDEVIFNS